MDSRDIEKWVGKQAGMPNAAGFIQRWSIGSHAI